MTDRDANELFGFDHEEYRREIARVEATKREVEAAERDRVKRAAVWLMCWRIFLVIGVCVCAVLMAQKPQLIWIVVVALWLWLIKSNPTGQRGRLIVFSVMWWAFILVLWWPSWQPPEERIFFFNPGLALMFSVMMTASVAYSFLSED